MNYNRVEKCPACAHDLHISKKIKIVRKEKHYINIVCNFCFHIFPIERKDNDDGQTQS
jgi:transcription elongation factor Elf1